MNIHEPRTVGYPLLFWCSKLKIYFTNRCCPTFLERFLEVFESPQTIEHKSGRSYCIL
jgi:hypothetical protein